MSTAGASRTEETQLLVRPQLGSLEYAFRFPHDHARRVVDHLHSCEDHEGVHHFAVVGEGDIVAFSAVALACLRAAGLMEPT